MLEITAFIISCYKFSGAEAGFVMVRPLVGWLGATLYLAGRLDD
jgi:hypothetical protein